MPRAFMFNMPQDTFWGRHSMHIPFLCGQTQSKGSQCTPQNVHGTWIEVDYQNQQPSIELI